MVTSTSFELATKIIDRPEGVTVPLQEAVTWCLYEDPHNERAHMVYGAVLQATGQLAKARAHFEVAHHLSPSDPEPLRLKSECSLDLGDKSQAIIDGAAAMHLYLS